VSTYVLRIVAGSDSGKELSATVAFEIGRDPAAGLALVADELVSNRHASVKPTDEGLVLEDLGSRNGTYVNGVQVAGPTVLSPGDRIVVGETTIEIVEQQASALVLVVSPHGEPAYEVPLGEPLEIGRDQSAGLPLTNDGQVSWRHARVAPHPRGVEVEDLGSSNGTFLNGARIVEPTVVEPGSRLTVGETTIEVQARGRVDTAVAPSFLSADTVASPVASPPQLVLEVVGSDGVSRTLPLDAPLEVGRDPSAGLVLDDQLVSRLHARLTPGDGEATVEDLGSRNGTFVNGDAIVAATVVRPGDQVVVGETTLLVGASAAPASGDHTAMQEVPPPLPEDPATPTVPPAPELVVQVIEGWAAGRQFRLSGAVEIGRDPAAGVPLVEDDGVSHRHARLTPSGEGAFVEDLGSSGGTFVNDVRVETRTLVVAGDRILVGSTVLRIRLAAPATNGP
jgi:pSer/pThr/pTyr-binding forkhead associated (FHA) protein